MAYADYSYYASVYKGSLIPFEQFASAAERASDYIDALTFNRLITAYPENDNADNKIKKATCAAAEIAYQLENAQKRASNTMNDTNNRGSMMVKSVSSGSESITYVTSAELSSVYKAVGDSQAEINLISNKIRPYLNGVRDAEGVPLLYAGVC